MLHPPMRISCGRLAATLLLLAGPVAAEEPRANLADEKTVTQTIERGLVFLAKDAMKWKEQHNCVSCHHASLIVWSMREAKQHGYSVDEPVFAELTKWVAEAGDGKTGVPRPPGRPQALNTKALYFALALGADPSPDEMSRQGLQRFWNTIQGDQIENGSWVAWPDTRPPFFGSSDESMTALAALALLPAAASDESALTARNKAIAWLRETKTDDDPQSLAMRLVLWVRLSRPAEEYQPLVQRIRERQNADGGWSQADGMPSDAWATGQALYALAHAGLGPDDSALARGHEFLGRTQREDGSWLMTSRPSNPDDKGAANLMPITGAGAAWAILGLTRSQ